MFIFVNETLYNQEKNVHELVSIHGNMFKYPYWFINMETPFYDFSEKPFFARDCNKRLRDVICDVYLEVILKLSKFKSKEEVKKTTLKIIEQLHPSTSDRLNRNSKYNILLKETMKAYSGEGQVITYKREDCKIGVFYSNFGGYVVKYDSRNYNTYNDKEIFYKIQNKKLEEKIKENEKLKDVLAWIDSNIVSRIKEIKYSEIRILLKIAESRIINLDLELEEKRFLILEIERQAISLMFGGMENDLPF